MDSRLGNVNSVFAGGGIVGVPFGCVENITPEIAEKYLSMNGDNPRRINNNVVKQYAADMKSGNWQMNGESIVFDRNGRLKNGQHRLLGVVRAQVTVPMMVVRGIDPEITSFDYQYKRSLKQEIGVSTVIASIASVVVTNCYSMSLIPNGLAKAYIFKNIDVLSRADSICNTGATHAKAKKRDFGVAIYLMLRNGANEHKLRDFFSVVNSGFPIEGMECSAAILLGKYIDVVQSNKARECVLRNIEFAMLAYDDFSNGVPRRRNYKNINIEHAQNLLTQVRAMDGLEM